MDRPDPDGSSSSANPRSALQVFAVHVLGRGSCLLVSLGFYLANRHYRLLDSQESALWCLGGALAFGYAGLHGLFGGLRNLALTGAAALALLGYWKGGPAVGQAAQSPFAIMAAMQALTHQNQPRSSQQAAALKDFAQSIPEVAQFAGGDMTSPANAARAMRVIGDLLGKAEALGATELQADPNYHDALRALAARTGLGIGLDSIDEALRPYASNPTVARQASALRSRLDRLRTSLNEVTPGRDKN